MMGNLLVLLEIEKIWGSDWLQEEWRPKGSRSCRGARPGSLRPRLLTYQSTFSACTATSLDSSVYYVSIS